VGLVLQQFDDVIGMTGQFDSQDGVDLGS